MIKTKKIGVHKPLTFHHETKIGKYTGNALWDSDRLLYIGKIDTEPPILFSSSTFSCLPKAMHDAIMERENE